MRRGETPRKRLKHCLFSRLRQWIIKYYRYIIFYFRRKNTHKLMRVFGARIAPGARSNVLDILRLDRRKSKSGMEFFISRR